MSARLTVARLLRAIGLLRADLLTRVTDRMPEDMEIKSGELVVVDNDGFRKWACLKCPGGCGQKFPSRSTLNGGRDGVSLPIGSAARASSPPFIR